MEGNSMKLDLGQEKANYFFQKLRAYAIWGHFFSWYNQKMRKGEFFKLLRIKKKSLTYEKKIKKTTLEFAIWMTTW